VLFRAREAWAGWKPFGWLEGRAGIVPTATTPELDGTWMMRAVAASPQEIATFLTPADVGASVRATLPSSLGWVSASVYDGDGYAQRELNRGKTLELAASVHPLATTGVLPLAVFASASFGSQGTGATQANRLTAGLLWQGARVRAGVDATMATGVDGSGSQKGRVIDAFVRAEPIDRWLVGARVARTSYDTSDSALGVTSIWVATGWRVARPLELYLAAARDTPGDRARDEIPVLDALTLRTIARIVF